MAGGALDGVLVADFSRVLAGPLATMMLADLGADVIKVERPGTGDETRTWSPPVTADGDATYFLAANRNKRSVTLDLSTVEGQESARALAGRADVLVENFAPGTMERFGLGYARLHAEYPRLVYASVSGFGRGAGADLPGYDFLVQAVGGLMSVTGQPDGEPTKVGVAVVDVLAGQHLATGILAALLARERTGRGQRVDVSLLGSAVAGLINQASGYLNAGVLPGRLGNAHPSIAPYQTLPTADRPIALAVGNDRQFARLAAVVGGLDAADPRFATNPQRVRNAAALTSVLAGRLATRPAAYWVAELTAAGVPCGVVNSIDEAFALAERLGLAPVVSLAGTKTVASPIALSETPVSYRRPPPRLGQHDAEVADRLRR
ncbi:MAG TPA: CoA transferase [Micromonosporaceae bacterium]|jgi:crotonobetainyl-CoA:carnitine CoA-transferase CaiB-like acyl-CoA transferase|nr:CoA transferase [Micromonosporaceae bacterium]